MEQRTDGEEKRTLVVVTGAGRGVGRATVEALINVHQAAVIAVSRDAAALGSFTAGLQVEPVVADITTPEGIARVVRVVGARAVHALVNNAGTLLKRTFGDWTASDLAMLSHVNAHTPLLLTQALRASLALAAPSHVVNIGSMGGFTGTSKFPGMIGYSSSKAALANIAECLAEELQTDGIRANCLCLGAVDTEMLREAFPGYAAPVTSTDMGAYVARFSLEGHKFLNGKVLPLGLSTP
jgi:NAD(P)-dependent dehydrogenase (short-subunit alcohol dehydrogenase family)